MQGLTFYSAVDELQPPSKERENIYKKYWTYVILETEITTQ
jgi:hypothetical protein